MRVLLIVLFVSINIACTSPSEIGADFVKDEIIDINYNDTLSVALSTVVLDSMATSTATRLLVGYYNDEYLGQLKSSAVFQFSPQSNLSISDNTTFDRLELRLKLDGYSYYDTLNGLKLKIYQLKDGISLEDEYLYNTSSFTAEDSPIATIDFIPEPNFVDSLNIKLSDEVGEQLFNLAYSESTLITDDFIDYFKGLAIVPDDAQQSCFVGISKSVTMRLYYNDFNSVPVKQKHVDFSMGAVYYNQIKAVRASTMLASIDKNETEIAASITDNLGFIQSGLGLGLKVTIPFLKEYGYVNGSYAVLKAELRLLPVDNYIDINIKPPTSFDLFLLDESNALQKQYITTVQSKFESSVLERGQYYSIDITQYVKNKLSNAYSADYKLLIQADDSELNNSINRIAFGDSNSKYKAKLKVYYVKIS